MYTVNVSEPAETMVLCYEVDLDGDNSEWRKCVEDILARLREDHEILEISAQQYIEGEDFVELRYSIDGMPLELSCDFLLTSLFITTNDKLFTKLLLDKLGNQVGWTP